MELLFAWNERGQAIIRKQAFIYNLFFDHILVRKSFFAVVVAAICFEYIAYRYSIAKAHFIKSTDIFEYAYICHFSSINTLHTQNLLRIINILLSLKYFYCETSADKAGKP